MEIFINRAELLPPDETAEQHRKNIEEERMAIEIDRTTAEGLFKGVFKPLNRVHRQWVEEDQLFVCSGCHHEHVDGDRRCSNCQVLFDDYDSEDYGDVDSMDGNEALYDMEVDGLDTDEDDHDDEADSLFNFAQGRDRDGNREPLRIQRQRIPGHYETDDDDDDEDTDSLREFIASDTPTYDSRLAETIRLSNRAVSEDTHLTISTDISSVQNASEDEEESDEEAVVTRRSRNRNGARVTQIISDSESETSDSSDSSLASASRRSAVGQSEDEDSESEGENNYGYDGYVGHAPLEDSDAATETSNSDTIQELDPEEDLRVRDSSISTPRRRRLNSASASPYDYGMDQSDNETEQYDRDGDIEMSVSPDESRASGQSDSDGSDDSSRRTSGFSPVDLGPATVMDEDEDDDDDDGSPVPPVRRRRQPRNSLSAQPRSGSTTLVQLFHRPAPVTSLRTHPTFDSHRILEWHASMNSSPENSNAQPRRTTVSSSSRPSRGHNRNVRRRRESSVGLWGSLD